MNTSTLRLCHWWQQDACTIGFFWGTEYDDRLVSYYHPQRHD